ncbi:DNA cytosine methyltransferase [Nevskia ramosa]|uniref:DNA cytosine methyltransferase n=1 Tax=Nevskia ramosa TaxID=64002 RepID=UPI003D13E198
MTVTSKGRKLRAIDLYSGVGGWSLGLRLAGIEVVGSYDRWGIANETNFKNNHHQAQTVDVRRLQLTDLPTDIDIVVGSPPCTEFSFSNRGGSGDLEDGLRDVIQFLSIVEHVRPRVWAMENVPRMAKIIEKESKEGGALQRFSALGIDTRILNLAEFGVPQRRLRCIAGNFDFDLLRSYDSKTSKLTLGQVVKSLGKSEKISDPVFGLEVVRSKLSDHVPEEPLNDEEIRINRAAKVTHTVYNAMSFPDRLDKPVRTITATCTRVSRESIVIASPEQPGMVRRLTVRERASLQGFPVTFQFYADRHSHKLRMIGNAIPPAFTYYLAHAMVNTPVSEIQSLAEVGKEFKGPVPLAVSAPPDRPGARFNPKRRFKFAIPSLQLKSGVRFEVSNCAVTDPVTWGIDFFFGNSKSIIALSLDAHLRSRLLGMMPPNLRRAVETSLGTLDKFLSTACVDDMQRIWSHKGPGVTTPFMLLDQLDLAGDSLRKVLSEHESFTQDALKEAISLEHGDDYADHLPGLAKLTRNRALIVAGLLVGATANVRLQREDVRPARRAKSAA